MTDRQQFRRTLIAAAALSTGAVLVMLSAGQARGEEAAGLERAPSQPAPVRSGRRHIPVDANGNLIRVSTAAGIEITVAPAFAPAIQGFIADAVAQGYRPPRITCFSLSSSHVPNSLHYSGNACDFNQHGWGKTDRFMYRVQALTEKWGLRNGCSFGDCGHIDNGKTPHWPRVVSR